MWALSIGDEDPSYAKLANQIIQSAKIEQGMNTHMEEQIKELNLITI